MSEAIYNSNFIHFIFSLVLSPLNGLPGEFNYLTLWRTVLWKGGRLRDKGDKNISKKLQIPNFWSCSLVDCVLGRWSPEGQWRGKLSPISQRGCSPAATEWCEEEKRNRNSHFLFRKKQVLRTGSQFRKCMRRQDCLYYLKSN